MATGYYASGAEAPLVDANWYRPAGNYFSSASNKLYIFDLFLLYRPTKL